MAKLRYYLSIGGNQMENGRAVYRLKRLALEIFGGWSKVEGNTTAAKCVKVFETAKLRLREPTAILEIVREPKHVRSKKSHVISKMRLIGAVRPYPRNRIRPAVGRLGEVGRGTGLPRPRAARLDRFVFDPPQAVPVEAVQPEDVGNLFTVTATVTMQQAGYGVALDGAAVAAGQRVGRTGRGRLRG